MQEFGRTPVCVCNVLALLGEGEEGVRATLRTAIDLAEQSNARLTLAKSCGAGRAYVWIAPFAVGGAYLPPEVDSPDVAAEQLTRLAAEVPEQISVTTLVLTRDPQATVLRLLAERHYGAVVIEASDLARWRRLRRYLRRESPSTVVVNCDAEPSGGVSITDQISSTGLTKDGAVDADQIVTRRRDPRTGMRPRFGRHIAGAGGEG